MKLSQLLVFFVPIFLSLNLLAKVIIVAPAGGLAGLASLVVANRIDEELHKHGYRFGDLVDHGVGASVGAQVVALLLQNNEAGGTKYSTSEAVDLFLQRMPETFPHFADLARLFLQSYVEKSDIDRVLKAVFEERVSELNIELLTKLWGNHYSSYASFWLEAPKLLISANDNLSYVMSSAGKDQQEKILRQKFTAAFGELTLASPQLGKLTIIGSHGGEAVVMGKRHLDLARFASAINDTPVVDALVASAAMEILPEQIITLQSGEKITVVDGANAYVGMSPLESVVQWSMEKSAEDDVIISLGNGGPFNKPFREGINVQNGFARLEKSQGSVTIFTLEPEVHNWYMASLVEEQDLIKGLIDAAQKIPAPLIERVAKEMLREKGFQSTNAISFCPAHMTVNLPRMQTAVPDGELERVCQTVVLSVGMVPEIVQKTQGAVVEAKRQAEELVKQEEMRRLARVAEEEKRRIEAESRRLARIAEEERQRVEAESRRLARIAAEELERRQEEARRAAEQAVSSVASFFRGW